MAKPPNAFIVGEQEVGPFRLAAGGAAAAAFFRRAVGAVNDTFARQIPGSSSFQDYLLAFQDREVFFPMIGRLGATASGLVEFGVWAEFGVPFGQAEAGAAASVHREEPPAQR
jgi:hypothetical protein